MMNLTMTPRILLVLAALLMASAPSTTRAAPAPGGTGSRAEQDFLAANGRADGVVALPGLQYKVLKSGPPDGAHPRRSDDITVRYEGRFLDGTVFGASPDHGAGVDVFPLQKLIPAWLAALQLMRPGDVWMLYAPAYMAYGAAGKASIPPDSTLIFRIELVAAAPHAETPATAAR